MTCLKLKSSKNLSNLFKEFNSFSSQQNKDTENIINCKYYNTDEIQCIYIDKNIYIYIYILYIYILYIYIYIYTLRIILSIKSSIKRIRNFVKKFFCNIVAPHIHTGHTGFTFISSSPTTFT